MTRSWTEHGSHVGKARMSAAQAQTLRNWNGDSVHSSPAFFVEATAELARLGI